MISIDEALVCYAEHINPLGQESLPLDQAMGRVLAAEIHSLTDLPRFDQSAMDGYACRYDDLERSSSLKIIGTAAAGPADAALTVGDGEAARIFTGGTLPAGADTVVPQERVRSETNEITEIQASAKGANIRRRGEELKTGALLANAGQRIRPGLIAALVMGGHDVVEVYRQPRVAVLATGDELREAGTALEAGEIHDSNTPLIRTWLARRGITPISVDRLTDEPDLIRNALQTALDNADLVITSGGVSVGERDYIIPIAEELGVQRRFWKVAQKPGKPLYFGSREDTALLGLPGNPGAVLVGLSLHVRRVLELQQGISHPTPQWQKGRLADEEQADSRRDRLLRMIHRINEQGESELQPLSRQDSHMMSNLSQANALVRLPARQTDYAQGELVDWINL